MLNAGFQSLLESPQALIGTVWSRQDFKGIVIRHRLFVISGYSYSPGRPTDDGSPVVPRLWAVGYTIWNDGGFGRPFTMLVDSLANGERYRQTDRMIDVKTGKEDVMTLEVHSNIKPVKAPKKRVVVKHA